MIQYNKITFWKQKITKCSEPYNSFTKKDTAGKMVPYGKLTSVLCLLFLK